MGLFSKILKKEQPVQDANAILTITKGTIMPIEASEDPVFAQKMMGDGYLIMPTDNNIYAPVTGEIITIFPTLHAIGIKSDAGDEIIIHVGLDTVKLDGEGFTAFVKQGDRVTAGQKILEVDFAKIKDLVPSIATPVVITNIGNRKVVLADPKEMQVGMVAMRIEG